MESSTRLCSWGWSSQSMIHSAPRARTAARTNSWCSAPSTGLRPGGARRPAARRSAPGSTSTRRRSRGWRQCRRTRATGSGTRTDPASSRCSRGSSPRHVRSGWSMSRRPTRPDELASPSGCALVAESSNRRAVPTPFAAHSTTDAASKCSLPSVAIHSAPVARPRPSTAMRRTRAPVTNRAPSADRDRPVREVGGGLRALVAPRRARAALHARVAAVVSTDAIALGSGHQCQPRRTWARASRSPDVPIGSGGSGGIHARRVLRVAPEARHAEVAVGALEVRHQLVVRHRPVVTHARERAGPEVGREQPRPHRVVEHGAAADPVEVADAEVAARAVDRVVGGRVTQVRRRRPLLAAC